MSIDFEKKFRSAGLDSGDCGPLRSKIIECRGSYEILVSHLYIYARSCDECPEVLDICNHYIREEPIPGLTAICMRVVIDYWDRWRDYCNEIERYLDLSLFDEWYDEVIFTAGFVNGHNFPFPPNIRRKLIKLKSNSKVKEYGIL